MINTMCNEFIPLCVPHLGGNAERYVKECIETEWVSYVGSYVTRFEDDLGVAAGASYVAAMNSGTSALHIALVMAGVGHDDEVVMPNITFVSPANAVRYCGAWPCLIDLDEADWQMSVSQTARFLEDHCGRRDGVLYNLESGRRIAAIMPVHLLGGMCDVDGFLALGREYSLPVVEDAAEALGAKYKGRKIAEESEGYEDVRRFVCTSFNGNKIITTGGGGALFSFREEDSVRAKHLSTTAKTDPIAFDHDEVGYNYRLTNAAAALGCAQLEQLDGHVAAKKRLAAGYDALFSGVEDVDVMPIRADVCSSSWLYTVKLKRAAVMDVIDGLAKEGIQTRPIWVPMRKLGYLSGSYSMDCGVGEELQECAISLPCSVGLKDDEQARVINELLKLV